MTLCVMAKVQRWWWSNMVIYVHVHCVYWFNIPSFKTLLFLKKALHSSRNNHHDLTVVVKLQFERK